MNESAVFFLYKLRFIVAGLLIIAGLFLISLLASAVKIDGVQNLAQGSSADVIAVDTDTPNVVTSGMSMAANELTKGIGAAVGTAHKNIHSIGVAAAQSGKQIVRGMHRSTAAIVRSMVSGVALVGRTVAGGIMFVSNTVISGMVYLLHIPGKVVGAVTNVPLVSAVIRPADHEEVPIIDPNSPALQEALAALPAQQAVSPASPPIDVVAAWPLAGKVTTEFGVPHRPYQHVHSGIDISSGQRAGITPIKPFRPGRVIEAVHSRRGLGNHVIVDHGNGVTSVYAHLASISVQVGQGVDKSTTLGYEGSTGVSTGTHLHFEIRVHGQAANPRLFINGHP